MSVGCLKQIRDCYLQIRQLTEEFLYEPTEEDLQCLLDLRSNLLSKVEPLKGNIHEKDQENPIVREIKNHIEYIVEMDKRAAEYIRKRMNEIQTELSTLQKNGTAVKAYTAQIRN
ncbi:hypothetical protein QA601_09815 [Chitinispirillales bacterium ANBcel5]|uniref:hypothetical protein n=1 Tax=Cellulosispirillum alkaliphilum TaxID=3039283 RepID=UPI002A55B8FF|nr:hypothetical protein [Chitinispirillales bacterium ANBcel5]